MVAAYIGNAFGVDVSEISYDVAMPAKTAPKIDGALDDACWKEALPHTAYYEYIRPRPAHKFEGTTASVMYDDKGLYVGVRNPEPFPGKLRQKARKNYDAPALETDDSGEIYLDPTGSAAGFYKFTVNSLGFYGALWRSASDNLRPEWKPEGLVAAAKVFEDRWEFELFIPWTALHGRAKPVPGEVWRFNHSRFRFTERDWGDFGASGVMASYFSPCHFGYLQFSDGTRPDAAAILATIKKRKPDCVTADKPVEKRRLGICLNAPRPGEVGRFCGFIRNRLAKDGFDTLVMLTRYGYRFESHPECAATHALGKSDIKKIVAACRDAGVALVPKMNLLGHQGAPKGIVKDGLLRAYPDMDESSGSVKVPQDYCRSLCPRHPKAQKIVFELMDELVDACEAKTVHVGCDEVFAIGMCPRCAGTPTAKLYADWVNGLVRHNRARNVRTMIWGDRLIDSAKTPYGTWDASDNGTHEALSLLDKDVIVCDWHYKRCENYPSVELFCDAGFETWICPFRCLESAWLFVDYAGRHERGNRLEGVLLTTWHPFADVADAIEGKPLRAGVAADAAKTLRGIADVFQSFKR